MIRHSTANFSTFYPRLKAIIRLINHLPALPFFILLSSSILEDVGQYGGAVETVLLALSSTAKSSDDSTQRQARRTAVFRGRIDSV